MIYDLIDLFDGWYTSFIQSVLPYSYVVVDGTLYQTSSWSLYIPWPAIFGFVFLCIGVISVVNIVRSIICRIF